MNVLTVLTHALWIGILLWVLGQVAQVQSRMESDYRNLCFLNEILYSSEIPEDTQRRAQGVIGFFQKWRIPLLVERSIKIPRESPKSPKIHRFTIPIALGEFITPDRGIYEEKWNEWWNLFEQQKEFKDKAAMDRIYRLCVDWILEEKGDVDFVWGVDEDREKIYLEDPEAQRIQMWRFGEDKAEEYVYTRSRIQEPESQWIAKYVRTKANSRTDAVHYQYREPKQIMDGVRLYFRSKEIGEDGEDVSDTYYIRV